MSLKPTTMTAPDLRPCIDLPLRHDIPLADQCSHGKKWTEDCRRCEVVSLADSLPRMEKAVKSDQARLERLRAEIAAGYT